VCFHDLFAEYERLGVDCMPGIALATLDRNAPEFDIPLTKARPWRAIARKGDIYRARRVG
jgi:hypothetical protein